LHSATPVNQKNEYRNQKNTKEIIKTKK